MEKGRPYQECVEFTKIIKPTQTPPTPNFEFVGVLESWFHQNWFENFEWFEIQSKSSHSDDYLKSLFLLKPVRGRLRGFMEMFFTKYQMHEKKWNVVADRRSNVLGGLRRFAVKFCVNKHHNKLTYLRLRFCILIDVPPYQPTRVVIPQPATLSQNPIICSTVTWWRTDKITSLWHHTMCRR